jgi:hypothetical protein
MNRMKYTDWQKLPSGGMWRRDPSTMRFIGLKGTNTGNRLSLTPKMTSETLEADEGMLGSTKTTPGANGTDKTISGSIGTVKTTPSSVGTTKTISGPIGTIKSTPGSIGTSNTTPRSFGTVGGSLGTTKMTSESFGTLNMTSGAIESLGDPKMTLGTLETTERWIGTDMNSPGSVEGPSDALAMASTVFGTSGTTITMSKTIQAMSVTPVSIHRSYGSTIQTSVTSRGMIRSTCTSHSPIIGHIIMLCGFEDDSVMIEYINQAGWTTLKDVVSIGVNDANVFYTVKSDGITFKARPLPRDIRMLKGFLMYYNRMVHKQQRFLNDDDVMNTFTVTDFEHYCTSEDYHIDMAASGSISIPSIETLIAEGVLHVESALRPSTAPKDIPPNTEEEQEDADIELEMILSDKYTLETLFVESWDHMHDDTEEYEVAFEEDNVTAGSLSCVLIDDCPNVEEEPLVLQIDIFISKWGAKSDMMHDGFNVLQGGAIKHEALNMIENGEQIFVVYNQRMLIAVLDSARVFDPGGQDN